MIQGAPQRHKLAVHIVPLQNSKESPSDKEGASPSDQEPDVGGREETDLGEPLLPEVGISESLKSCDPLAYTIGVLFLNFCEIFSNARM